MSLREKLNKLDSQNLQNNDTLYSILEEMLDKIEKLEQKSVNSTKREQQNAEWDESFRVRL